MNPKATVMIVDDERDLRGLVADSLRGEGYRVYQAGTAEAGLRIARKHRPGLLVLDVMLPKMDGLDLCRVLRAETDAPILFLSAKASEVDRVVGFRLGADDYVVKPFSVLELLARVKAILKRGPSRSARGRGAPVRLGKLVVDLERREVRVDDQLRPLRPRELQVLALLLKARGRVVSRERILERLWGFARDLDISTRTVDQHVARLRRKLSPEGRRILTVTNMGYRLPREERAA